MIAMLSSSQLADAGRRRPRRKPTKSTKAPAKTPAPTPTPKPGTLDPAWTTGTWKTTIEVVLRKTPGERAPAVVKLPVGTVVVIEAEQGRWLRVRVGTQVGYLTRTTVATTTPPPVEPEPTPPAAPPTGPSPFDELAPTEAPAKRWGSDRIEASRAGTGLFVGVTAPTGSVLAEPRSGATKIVEVPKGTRLTALETSGGAWVHVRDDAGHEGWIGRAEVDNSTASVAIGGAVPVDVDDAQVTRSGTETERPARKLTITAGAALGYRSVGMDFTSNGSVGLSNYLVSADAAAADLGVDVAARVGSRLRAGADARFQVGTSSGSGIEYVGPSRAGGRIPFKTLEIDSGARVGTRLGHVFEVAARAGFHYDAFLANNVDNAGRLPRERLIGATLGARFGISPPRSRVDVALRIDVLALGRRAQTAGLEDGTSSDAGALWAGATIRIALAHHLSLLSAYDFGRATTTWSGMSVRFSDVTQARRVDSTQTVQLGIAAEL